MQVWSLEKEDTPHSLFGFFSFGFFFLLKLFHCISLSLFHLFPFLFYSFIVFTFFLVYVCFMFLFFIFLFCLSSFFLFLCIYVFIYFVSIFFFKKILVFLICSIMKIYIFKNFIFVWLNAGPLVFPKDFFNRNGTSRGPSQRLPWPPCPALPLPCPACHQLHREWAVTGRIFQALPTQTDTTVALIYKIAMFSYDPNPQN
jgi:hypothetical protein